MDDDSLVNLKLDKDASALDVVTSAGWIKDDRRRFSKYTVVRWGSHCKGCKALTYRNDTNCEGFFGDPLIKSSSALV
ncbi:hypothetical protein Trydic_g14681, partial [Trypoxylus dichotomus]